MWRGRDGDETEDETGDETGGPGDETAATAGDETAATGGVMYIRTKGSKNLMRTRCGYLKDSV